MARNLPDLDLKVLPKDHAMQKWLQPDQEINNAIAHSTNEATQLKISMLDVVRLKDGREAAIVEVIEDQAYYADVGSSPEDWDTIFITVDDIESVTWRTPATE